MASDFVAKNAEAAILGRATDSLCWDLSPAATRSILGLKASPEVRERMDALVARASTGAISADEEVEIESYRRVGALVEVLCSRARLRLKRTQSSASPESASGV